MAITLLKGAEGTYKTTIMFQIIRDMILTHKEDWYTEHDLITNVPNYITGSVFLKNDDIKQYIRDGIKLASKGDESHKHKIIALDEIDSILGHRGYTTKEQTETCLATHQSRKMFWNIIGTAHLGFSVDVILREHIRKEYIAKGYNPDLDQTKADVIDVAHMIPIYQMYWNRTQNIQKLFYSWGVIV